MSELISYSIAQAREKMSAGEFTSAELTQAYLDAIGSANETFNAYIAVTGDKALEMASASDAFSAALDSVDIQPPSVPVIGNTTAAPLTTADDIRAELNAQLTGSVRWTESMQYLVDQGVTGIYEVGSGDVLQKLMKRIGRKVARKAYQ